MANANNNQPPQAPPPNPLDPPPFVPPNEAPPVLPNNPIEWCLRQLQCPFQGTVPDESAHYCPEIATDVGCPFGHQIIVSPPAKVFGAYGTDIPQPPPPPPRPGLMSIPPGVCIDHLMKRCQDRVRKDPQSGKENCRAGSHWTIEDLRAQLHLRPN